MAFFCTGTTSTFKILLVKQYFFDFFWPVPVLLKKQPASFLFCNFISV